MAITALLATVAVMVVYCVVLASVQKPVRSSTDADKRVAAAANSLKMQASELVRQMAQFKVQEESPRLQLS
jgi:hypothetical protein